MEPQNPFTPPGQAPDQDLLVEHFAANMVALPGGTITLQDEKTRRRWQVQLRPFSMARHPVTEAAYLQLVSSPDHTPSQKPVTGVSWLEAVRFCNLLSERAGLQPCYTFKAEDVHCDRDADGYRLPTEAEWEHACRAGTLDVRYGDLDTIAWHRENSGGSPQPVGLKEPNAWGLFDTIGNVWEWCWDLFDPQVYGPYRVFRGGGWFDGPRSCRASCRRKSHPTFAIDDLGFRLVRSRF